MATLPRMKPERFYDLVVEVAIIRPGPVVGKMVSPYLARRNGKQPVTYSHPCLEPILRRTLGVPLFQEQLLRMAMTAAGFSGGQAEELRRAMGFKRSAERMKAIESDLYDGMTRKGIPHAAQEEIVKGIQSFALYGFPESHAASFALIAYASAYLKAYYPAAFLCALLNNQPMGFYHSSTLIQDAARHGVRTMPVDVTCSAWASTLEEVDDSDAKTGVRLGLKVVRGLRKSTADQMIAARPVASLAELCRRVDLNAAERANLAEIGAFARLGGTRRQALWQVSAFGQSGKLYDGVKAVAAESCPLPDMTANEEVMADFRGTGVYTGGHPISFLRKRLNALGVVSAEELLRIPHGRRARIGGLVIVRQRPSTAKGLVFITLEDETGFANALVSAKRFEESRRVIVSAESLIIEGIVENHEGIVTVKAEKLSPFPAEVAGIKISHDFS
jgi:error-prone DNA polymerase